MNAVSEPTRVDFFKVVVLRRADHIMPDSRGHIYDREADVYFGLWIDADEYVRRATKDPANAERLYYAGDGAPWGMA